jgi:K(+)-stimulated pyrophosphate-energized sodium pump
MLPFWIAGAGIAAGIIGFFAIGTHDGADQKQLMMALYKGTIVSSLLVIAFSAVIIIFVFQDRED